MQRIQIWIEQPEKKHVSDQVLMFKIWKFNTNFGSGSEGLYLIWIRIRLKYMDPSGSATQIYKVSTFHPREAVQCLLRIQKQVTVYPSIYSSYTFLT